ncbi:Chlorophyll a-b binding protein 7, chloroplastic [Tetrabaena socialis]|uniref:Chlorophyll a-b binding protein, chloroplastic n=1 Tax=Tetrabaena socialis TaxID=47790 RepID=A0A2J7ZS12_9CHLO|nr:Chlorophyll a-b binding protein 7, chloroplastic [Tetrabaena socialis]|eukprot:PNH03048.1 Chlorophyll a-b binding protein 7, chloroplastic [Tetrabaena socialis]
MAMMMKSSVVAVRPVAARKVATCAARPGLWLPGGEIPSHLDSPAALAMAGNFGFDPLGLGKDAEALRWYQQAELVHCRTAMAGVAGIVIPSLLTKAGALSVPEWYDAGEVSIKSGSIPFGALLAVQLFLCGFVEVKRWMDFKKPGSQAEKGTFLGFESSFAGTGENGYPGGIFDPMGFAKDSAKLADYKLREVKNGRLAMIAFLGFAAQKEATGKGPIDNLFAHLADPWHVTFASNGVSIPGL